MSKTGQTLPDIIVAPACNPEELRVQSRNTLLEASVHSNTENLGHIIFSMTVCIIAVQNILFLLKTFLFLLKQTNKQHNTTVSCLIKKDLSLWSALTPILLMQGRNTSQMEKYPKQRDKNSQQGIHFPSLLHPF